MTRPFRLLAALPAALGLAFGVAGGVSANTTEEHPKHVRWANDGPFGRFDQAQLQRGYKVYREVCSSCHSMNLVSFRNLAQKGGPFYDPAYKNPNDSPIAKTLARDAQIPDIDSETGDAITRPGTPADRLPNPYPNEAAARAGNGGAYPPDQSLITKAREGGAPYVYSLITGYPARPPAGLEVPAGKYYNPYMPGDLSSFWSGDHKNVPVGGFIAMAPPLTAEGQVSYDDGTRPTVDQMAKDVTAFLTWAAEPKAVERKQTGFAVLIYLLIFTVLVWFSYRRIWRDVAH